ncbi:PRC-barrel domain-containing protein [Gymnodinialimonas sp. 57CJ19]|uniref:PRC-barrel domain-containing protein n=1 Tax=Gymnodinialimonas sp. 57CJ19 TaxID=3138498 RepID=UPI0031343407
MKRFLITTAAASVMATGAFADAHSGPFSGEAFNAETNLNASEVIGARVYVTENETGPFVTDDGEQEWDDIGEINEIILTRDGDVQSVIVGVGGFLGIGERDVAVNMDQIQFVSDGEDSDEYFLVVNAAVADVEQAPEYERTAMAMGGDEEMHSDMDADADMDEDADMMTMDDPDRPRMAQPAIERDGYETVGRDDLTTEDLTGARVYGSGDEDVGEVSELLLSDDGTLERAVLDIGGFLGLGEHSIAVTFDELQIVRGEGGDVRVYIDSTQEALEAQPAYEG